MMNIIKILFGFLSVTLLSVSVSASPEIEKTLVNRISQSQSELQSLQKKMMQESAQYASQLDRQQQQIKSLREKAAVIRRQKDEQLLGLDQLKTRVDQWKSQSNYQRSLLTHYVESTGLAGVAATDENKATPATLQVIAAEVQQKLNPQWTSVDLVTSSGDVVKSQLIQLGAVKLIYNAELDVAGIASDDANESRIGFAYNSQQKNGIAELHSSSAGVVSFDPTLGKAFELIGQNDTLLGHIEKGGAWAIPIVIFGLVSLIISLLKTIEFIRLPKLDKGLADALAEETSPQKTFEVKNKIANAGLPQQGLLDIVRHTSVSQQRDDLMVAYLMEYKHKVERFMGIVSVSATIAPLLGLLGTVSGMISTFKMMTIFGTSDASTVSGGISVALITTELGLIVAIPSLIASALLSRKIKNYLHDLESFAIKISKITLN
jgi:biopolymer transport protein ExbB